MDLVTILILGIIVVAGFTVYSKYQLEKLQKSAIKTVMDSIPQLQTETSGNMIYLYDQKTKAFQCQASDIDELAKAYDRHWIAQVKHNDEELWFVDGEVVDDVTIIPVTK